MAASLPRRGGAAAALAVARRRSDASPRRWRCAALLVALVAGVAGDEGQATPFDVTLVTQATTEKLWLVPELCERWRGPLSLSLWITRDEGAAAAAGAEAAAGRAAAACAAAGGLALTTRVEAPGGEPYPVNRLRNLALARVNTSHHLVSDVDFLPSRGLRAAAVAQPRWLGYATLALVVPAFQRRGGGCKTVRSCRDKLEPLGETVPGTFGALVRCLEAESCIVFQGDNSATSHSTTDSAAWLTETAVRPIPCFRSNRYEPYFIVRTSPAVTPRYDERFAGYGKNKIQHVTHLRKIGFAFAVLPRAFLVHVPHPKSAAKDEWQNSYETHRAVDTLYAAFLRDLEASTPPQAVKVHLCSALDGDVVKKKKPKTGHWRRHSGG
jgi:hypothetical protein